MKTLKHYLIVACFFALLLGQRQKAHATVYADSVVSYGPCSSPIPLLCPSGVLNPGYAVDQNMNNYSTLMTAIGVGASAHYEVMFPVFAQGGSVVSFILQPENETLDLNLLQALSVQLYDTAGNLVHNQVTFDVADVDLLSGTGQRYVLNVYAGPGNYTISRARINVGGLLSVVNTLRLYGVFYNLTCPPVFADTLMSQSNNVLLCLTGCVNNAANIVDTNPLNYGELLVPLVAVGSSIFIEVGFPTPADTNDFIGFTVQKDPALLGLDLFQGLGVDLLDTNGGLLHTISDLNLADLYTLDGGISRHVLGRKIPNTVTQPVYRARIWFSSTLSLLYQLRVYNAFHYTIKAPFAVITPSNPVLCQGTQVVLTAASQASYQWLPGGETTPSITVSAAGSYTLTVTDNEGCVSSDAYNLLSAPLPSTPVITADGASAICNGTPADLTASGNGDLLWSTGDTTDTIMVSIPGIYSVTVTDSNNCISAQASVLVSSVDYTTSISTVGASVICNGGSVTLSTNATENIVWSTGDTTQSITVSAAGPYSVTGTDTNNCASSAAMLDVEESDFSAAITGDTVGCDGDPVSLQVEEGASFVWSTSETTQEIVIDPVPDSLVVSVLVTDQNGCQDTDSLQVYAYSAIFPALVAEDDNVEVDLGMSETIHVTVNDNAAGGIITITSQPSHGTVTIQSDSTVIYTADAGFTGMDQFTYTICASLCSTACDNAVVRLMIRMDDMIMIPQAVTPNGDGFNDVLVISNIDKYPENELVILNRWGDIVYTAQPYNNEWSGQSNFGMKLLGDRVTDGTYFYAFIPVPGMDPMKGFFELRK